MSDSPQQPKVMVDVNELKGYEPPEHVKRAVKAQRMNSPYVVARIHAIGRVIAAVVLALAVVAAALILAGRASAAPGQCVPGVYTPWGGGGFCDSAPYADGTWMHCETVIVMGFGGTNCFRVRPVPVEVDARGWAPV